MAEKDNKNKSKVNNNAENDNLEDLLEKGKRDHETKYWQVLLQSSRCHRKALRRKKLLK